MPLVPVTCTNCGSDKWPYETCEACLDRTDEEWALHDAREAYASGKIDAAEMEQRIEVALTAPPRRYHPRYVYR